MLIFPLTTIFFLAAAHRRDDSKTLSCQDRALPSGTDLGVRAVAQCGKGAHVTKSALTCFSWNLEQVPE